MEFHPAFRPSPCPAHITSGFSPLFQGAQKWPPAKRAMSNSTETSVTEFALLGFPELRHGRGCCSSFLTIYMVTILENLVVMATIRASRQLHTPMYFFLANLSVLETLYTSVTIPKLLAGLSPQQGRDLLLRLPHSTLPLPLPLARPSASSWPPWPMTGTWPSVAPCTTQPSWTPGSACAWPSVPGWAASLASCVSTALISRLRFCGPNVLNHFPVTSHPCCSSPALTPPPAEVLDFVAALAVLATSLLATVIPYTHIVATVPRVPGGWPPEGVFSTCALYLGSGGLFTPPPSSCTPRPHAISSFDLNKLVSVVYSVVTPLLNPIIYCLRNHDIHEALAKLHPPRPS